MFDIVCTNVKNDIKSLDVCIKDLRSNIGEGKKLYGHYALTYKYLSNFEDKIKSQMSEFQTLTTRLQLPEENIEDFGTKVEKIHNVIKRIEADKE